MNNQSNSNQDELLRELLDVQRQLLQTQEKLNKILGYLTLVISITGLSLVLGLIRL